MSKSEIVLDPQALVESLSSAGENEQLRNAIFHALREAEARAKEPLVYREQVRWPIMLALLNTVKTHKVTLDNGLVFEVSPDSRIEKCLLLSSQAQPDHAWEPQTTKLLLALADKAENVIVGGAYYGDQVLPLALTLSKQKPMGLVHAFEPMEQSYRRLINNINLNSIKNVVSHRVSLWNESKKQISLRGQWGIASSAALDDQHDSTVDEVVESITIDDYVTQNGLSSVSLIMLDTEGGEEMAFLGAAKTLAAPKMQAPHLVFEIHRSFVDWDAGLQNTSVCKLVASHGYTIFAVRDYQGNEEMQGRPIELVPIDTAYLEGPPHGFNLFATKQPELIDKLGFKVVPNVSPKLLHHRDPALHQPIH